MNRVSDKQFRKSMKLALKSTTDDNVRLAFQHVMRQRSEILEAFVAKYGFEPDECVQVEFQTEDGKRGWSVRKRRVEEP